MKKRKIIIICTFLLLILSTAIYTVVSAIKSYNYDMNPANGIDIMKGFDAVFIVMIGGFIIFYELDLFYTVYYFFTKPKTVTKSLLNVFANLSLLLVYFNDFYKDILKEDVILPFVVVLIYIILRVTYLIISVRALEFED